MKKNKYVLVSNRGCRIYSNVSDDKARSLASDGVLVEINTSKMLSEVHGLPPEHWKWTGEKFVPSTQAERKIVIKNKNDAVLAKRQQYKMDYAFLEDVVAMNSKITLLEERLIVAISLILALIGYNESGAIYGSMVEIIDYLQGLF